MISSPTLPYFILSLFISYCLPSLGKELRTNQVIFHQAPDWLTEYKLQAVIDRVQSFLEWDLNKIEAFGYGDQGVFNSKHNLSFSVDAIFKKSDSTIHVAPNVDATLFERVFGHELVHAIFFQKHKQAIPIWLEEGLANHVSQHGPPDYHWLVNKSWGDVTEMGHPNKGLLEPKLHYTISTALIEMIESKCSLRDLLQLSVGKKMESYLTTYCDIKEINTSFRKWVEIQALLPYVKDRSTKTTRGPWWKNRQKR